MSDWAQGPRFSPMALPTFPHTLRGWRPRPAAAPVASLLGGLGLALAVALVAIGPERLLAQIEGERGIAPIASTTDIQVGGIQVNTTGKDAVEARLNGWKDAQRKAWEAIKGPAMSDGQIDALVSAVVIEHEQIGPRRYVATLGVIFDRAKAGQFLAAADPNGGPVRSAPLLVIPVLYSGGTAQVFEVRGPWQRAWANFATAASPVDYVRPAGAGGDSLLLTAGQPGRRSRTWWRALLDQFGATDVIMPVARLERQWPGGPVKGTFTARHGPDNVYLDSFTMTAPNEEGVPKMLAAALVRIDRIYADALSRGVLRPDPTLVEEQHAVNALLATLTAALQREEAAHAPPADVAVPVVTPSGVPSPVASAAAPATTVTIQFASADAKAVDAALGAVRGLPGVQSAATTSIAVGGTSVMRVTATSDLEALAGALRARGWQVSVGSNALSIRR